MITKPKLLIIFAKHGTDTSTRFGGFVKRIQRNGGFSYADVEYTALEDLLFHINDDQTATVTSVETGIDIADYAFVYFKSWESMRDLAASAAVYLTAKGVPFADEQLHTVSVEKTVHHMAMWRDGVSVPESIWGSPKVIRDYLSKTESSHYPLILKSTRGQKGEDNYLVSSKDQALEIIETATTGMLLQQFIPNEGDYRIGVYGNKARWAIYRRSSGKSHLNNTSAGATAELLDIKDLSNEMRSLAERGAHAVELSVSGVDIVADKDTGRLYVLEANQGSQIVTGKFTESNMAAFDDGMRDMVTRRYAPVKKKKLQIIGRHVNVILEGADMSIPLTAKVDTGAYQSSLHAENIQLETDSNGKQFVSYVVTDPTTEQPRTFISYEFWRALIRNSFGVDQMRIVVPMNLRINGTLHATRVSLADRSTQKYPLLIGRKLLRGNFIVNVELGAQKGASE